MINETTQFLEYLEKPLSLCHGQLLYPEMWLEAIYEARVTYLDTSSSLMDKRMEDMFCDHMSSKAFRWTDVWSYSGKNKYV